MSLKIEISLPDDNVTGVNLEQHMAALGFTRRAEGDAQLALPLTAVHRTPAEPETVTVARPRWEPVQEDVDSPRPAAPKRERGKPDPASGRARRTKAEIAEDEAAATGGAASISTDPENRVGPEDDEATAAADAADEAAEVEAHRDAENPLTHDDLRQAVGRLIKKIGMAAATTAVPAILGCKQAEVPDTQEALFAAISKIDTAVSQAGAEPAKIEEKPVEQAATPKTKADVIAAAKLYALKYDGQNTDLTPAKAPHTDEDVRRIIVLCFGAGVTKLSQIPDTAENWAKVEAGIVEALAKDPFKRGSNG